MDKTEGTTVFVAKRNGHNARIGVITMTREKNVGQGRRVGAYMIETARMNELGNNMKISE